MSRRCRYYCCRLLTANIRNFRRSINYNDVYTRRGANERHSSYQPFEWIRNVYLYCRSVINNGTNSRNRVYGKYVVGITYRRIRRIYRPLYMYTERIGALRRRDNFRSFLGRYENISSTRAAFRWRVVRNRHSRWPKTTRNWRPKTIALRRCKTDGALGIRTRRLYFYKRARAPDTIITTRPGVRAVSFALKLNLRNRFSIISYSK